MLPISFSRILDHALHDDAHGDGDDHRRRELNDQNRFSAELQKRCWLVMLQLFDRQQLSNTPEQCGVLWLGLSAIEIYFILIIPLINKHVIVSSYYYAK